MKTMVGMVVVLVVTGCAGYPPVWQQELNNLHRHHRVENTPIVPEPVKVSRPDYSAVGLYSCGLKGDYRY